MLRRDGGGARGGILQPPGAHSQEEAVTEQSASVLVREESCEQEGAEVAQPPLLATSSLVPSWGERCREPRRRGEE